MRVILTGATGTIGRAVLDALIAESHQVFCLVRSRPTDLEGALCLPVDFAKPSSVSDALAGQPIDAVISCMATRSGAPSDAWTVEHDAQLTLMREAEAAGARHFILLSAICVQKPLLAFQHAKLAFEAKLKASRMDWSIIRPTAYFKSLSGQVARVQAGKPFLLFGDGKLTACKPISDRDLARFILSCLSEPDKRNKILPIGGPGPAITPLDQAHRLFEMLGEEPRLRHVPLAMMDVIAGGLGVLGRVSKRLADKAEFARTGRYYATQSMLHWDEGAGRFDADATPEFGKDRLWEHYGDLLSGKTRTNLGAHKMF